MQLFVDSQERWTKHTFVFVVVNVLNYSVTIFLFWNTILRTVMENKINYSYKYDVDKDESEL